MKTYIYKAIDSSNARGFNRTIVVFRVKHNKPEYIGRNDRIQTASTYGDKGEAVQLISEIEGYKHDSYNFLTPNINLWSV